MPENGPTTEIEPFVEGPVTPLRVRVTADDDAPIPVRVYQGQPLKVWPPAPTVTPPPLPQPGRRLTASEIYDVLSPLLHVTVPVAALFLVAFVRHGFHQGRLVILLGLLGVCSAAWSLVRWQELQRRAKRRAV